MTPAAKNAIRAAQNWFKWGPWAAKLYARKQGVPFRLLGLAVALEGLKRKLFGIPWRWK